MRSKGLSALLRRSRGPAAGPPVRRTRTSRFPNVGGTRAFTAVAFLAVFTYGVGLRAWDLGSDPFWVDEAESCINALTIHTHGVPVDHYLGLPIYENVYTRPWPENPEYEFRDTSYSHKGLAIYHGWLPLYSISASFAAAGIGPDTDETFRGVKFTPGELRRRTVAGRLPSVFFGAAFLVCAFIAGRLLYGADAGWAALLTAAVCKPAVDFGRQARYYSPTLAVTTFVCLAVWLMYRHGRWRDFLLGAVAFALLFHAHVLSFVIACAACGLLIPGMFRHERAAGKMLVTGAVVAAAVFPWVIFTGFLGASTDIPKARELLSFPDDWLAYPRRHYLFSALTALALVWLLAVRLFRRKLPEEWVRPFLDHRTAFLWLAAWVVLGYLAFLLFIPSASYFYRRMTLTVMGPGLLFMAMLFTAAGRTVVGRRWSGLVGAALFIAALGAFGKVRWRPEPGFPELAPTWEVVEHLRARPIPPGTKVYATPNDHLTLTFYTGMPVGAVAPVRKSFLDTYPGRVLILEAPRYDWLSVDEIIDVAWSHGFAVLRADAVALEPVTRFWLAREDVGRDVPDTHPPLEPLPPVYEALLAYQRWKTQRGVENSFSAEGNPIFKGYHGTHYGHWWQTFFYRFVGPEGRTGPNLNYANRVKTARADVLPLGWVFYDCPPLNAAPTPPVSPPSPAPPPRPAGQ